MQSKLLNHISIIDKLVLQSRTLESEMSIIRKFVDATRNILGADYGYALRWNSTGNKFELTYKDTEVPYIPKTPRKQGITARAFNLNRPIFIDHTKKVANLRSDAKKFMKAVVIIPITYGNARYGVIDICFYEDRLFTEEERILCEYIGNSAAQSIAIERAEKELRRLIKQKDEFFNIASHELKTPITTIKGFAQILGDHLEEADFQTKYFLGKVNSQVDKLEHLINDLLDISRIETGKIKFDKKYFNLGRLIDKVVEEMKISITSHKISFKRYGHFTICGDRERIERVMINLITNAAKYSPKGTKIEIQLKKRRGAALVEVEDYGYGIIAKDRPRVFNRFFQSNHGSKKSYPGLGLGLHISKEIITHHGGEIDFISKKNKGTVFFFTLPQQKQKSKKG